MRLHVLLRAELYLLVCALFPATIYFFTHDANAAFRVLLICFGVPQPFLIYALRDQLFGRRRR